MTIALRGSVTGSRDDAGAGTQVINVPTGVQNGDLLLFFGHIDNSVSTFTKPAAWTALPTNGLNWDAGALGFKICNGWYRIANSEPASYTITKTAAVSEMMMAAYSGVDNVTPLDNGNATYVQSPQNANSPNTKSVTGITTVTANTQICIALLIDESASGTAGTISSGSSMTVQLTNTATTNLCPAGFADVAQAGIGASGTKSFTFTVGTKKSTIFAYTIALRPGSTAAQFVSATTATTSSTGALTTGITAASATTATTSSTGALTTSIRCASATIATT